MLKRSSGGLRRQALVSLAIRQRVPATLVSLFLIGMGLVRFLPLNAESSPVPPLFDIVTQSAGQSAEEIEHHITSRLETQLAGIPNVTEIRSISLFGLSDIALQFNHNVSHSEAQQWVIRQLSQLAGLPANATPEISTSSPISDAFSYRVVGSPGYSVMDLKTVQDRILRPRLKAMPGVVDVIGWTGDTKGYEITVGLNRLIEYGLAFPQVLEVLNNNTNVGGHSVNFAGQAAIVHGVGLIHSRQQISDATIIANNGAPVRIGDIATIKFGPQPRLGIVGQEDGGGVAQGVILMRRGEQGVPTIERVRAEVENIKISDVLPPGIRIEPIYDVKELISRTTLHTIVTGIVLIFFCAIGVFLGNRRSAIIVSGNKLVRAVFRDHHPNVMSRVDNVAVSWRGPFSVRSPTRPLSTGRLAAIKPRPVGRR